MESDETPEEMEAAFEQDAAAAEAQRNTPGERNKQIRRDTRRAMEEGEESVRRAGEERQSDGEGDSAGQ